MIYLKQFNFLTENEELSFLVEQKLTCYNTFYPFKILPKHQLEKLEFEPVTVLYGGNGSGKTTVLNIIAEKLNLKRDTLYNRSSFFEDYTAGCSYELMESVPQQSAIITSDDVFDYMMNIRHVNQGIDFKRENLFDEYTSLKYSDFQLKSLDDYEQLKKVNMSRRKTQSKFVRNSLMDNVREMSNGESAFMYFVKKIEEGGLYLLDEPENSLSPERQLELLNYIKDSARFFECQFIIATHSPFLLSMEGAKIYDLDEEQVSVKKWTQLENVRHYYDFFKKHQSEFEEDE